MKPYELVKHFLEKTENRLSADETQALKENEWLKILWLKNNTDDINIENFDDIKSIKPHATLEYVYRTLLALEEEKERLNAFEYAILADVLCYSEVAKGGTFAMKSKWREKGYVLSIHNIGSSQIFQEIMTKRNMEKERLKYTRILIATHGLLGQYLRGETSLKASENLVGLSLPGINHEKVVKILNKCILCGVSKALYEELKNDIDDTIEELLSKNLNRLRKLRKTAIVNGEDFDKEYQQFAEKYPECLPSLNNFLNRFNFWYIEAATSEFRLEETLKLFIYIERALKQSHVTDISFKNFMSFYCDYQGKKSINIFKERVIEKLLLDYDVTDEQAVLKNEHVELIFEYENGTSCDSFLNLKMQFSKIAEKFVDFCIEAIGEGAVYDQIITMACDHFGIRRDQYDRFYNEYTYLQTMNATTNLKKILVDYIAGDKVIDVGPGGGGLMDAILEKYPEKEVIGIDVAENVIEKLNKIKSIYGKKWNVMKGDALNLGNTFQKGDFHSIIFCSILHELFSYIPYNGKKFNYDTLKTVFTSVYHLLPKGGRLIIRDGIMTESSEERLIVFKNPEDIKILKRYAKDFQGRNIQYEIISNETVKMPINDAMEFLYTYTWGEESYAHEINEQFGYFTPNDYIHFVTECFEGNCKIEYTNHYLQKGYSEHLLQKVQFLNPLTNEAVDLPDSTFILVVEKL